MNKTLSFPEITRMFVGFDEAFDRAMTVGSGGYPPYNIEKLDEDRFTIVLAVAGFRKEELTVTAPRGKLIVEGQKAHEDSSFVNTKFIHKGIADRDFSREFRLADYIEVDDVSLENGLLSISLRRLVPEELKPKILQIK